ncbi:MAG: hypothetical protein R2746_02500 [Acidimicrobiales bacterium]
MGAPVWHVHILSDRGMAQIDRELADGAHPPEARQAGDHGPRPGGARRP